MSNPLKRLSRRIRGRIRALGLRSHGIGVVADTAQGLFVVDPHDFGVGRTLLDRGAYELDIIAKLLERVTPESTVVFVGCHIGTLLIPIAAKVKQVIGFEANPETFKLLDMNVRLNGLTNVRLLNAAASAERSRFEIEVNPINSGGSTLRPEGSGNSVSIDAIPLDEIVGDCKIDLMVIDVEGHEVQVYSGATAALRNTAALYTEYSPRQIRAQGDDTQSFIAALSPYFRSMHYGPGGGERFTDNSWEASLQTLPEEGDQVLTLLFTDSTSLVDTASLPG